jgi:hypothetical protein
VGPVFGLAVFVEITIVMGRALAQKKSRKKQATTRALARTVVRTNAGLLLVSEGAALYAVGANVSSTFLLTSVLGPWLLQIYLLVDTAYHRIGVSKLGRGA